MKRSLLITGIFLFFNVLLFAQDNESVLWEISGNGVEKPSYLFGTIHVAPIALLDSFPQVMRYAESCDFGIFESGGKSIGNAPTYTEPDHPPLDSLFTPEEYAIVDSFFTASPHGSIRPHNNDAELLAMIQVAMVLNSERTKGQYDMYDDHIYQKLSDLKKPIFHLDIQSDIDEVKEDIGYRNLAKYLVYVIKDAAEIRDVVAKNDIDIDLYSTTMTSPMKLDQKIDPKVYNATVERNKKWILKIEKQMKQGNCFIAVGLGHLQYESGLIQLLRKQGYTLKAVKL